MCSAGKQRMRATKVQLPAVYMRKLPVLSILHPMRHVLIVSITAALPLRKAVPIKPLLVLHTAMDRFQVASLGYLAEQGVGPAGGFHGLGGAKLGQLHGQALARFAAAHLDVLRHLLARDHTLLERYSDQVYA